jgi:hypothetical protein
MSWLWGAIAAAALVWPDRVSGLFDGVPLDRIPEAVVVAAVFPLLWGLHPSFLRRPLVRTIIVLLVAWRAIAASAFAQEGWCVRFAPARPYAKDAVGAPHAWDLRADWRSADPSCSAIATQPYHDLHEFPAWFFNLPPDSDSWPTPLDRPPGATVVMTVRGFLDVAEAGRLRIDQDASTPSDLIVDGRPAAAATTLAAGLHTIDVRTTLSGETWRFVPTWNDRDLWSAAIATVTRPSTADLLARRWLRAIPTLLVVAFIGSWLLSAVTSIGTTAMWAWAVAAGTALAALAIAGRADLARAVIPMLALAAVVPPRPRPRTVRDVLLLVGVPWLAFIVACASAAIGRFVLYGVGHDYWMFQRFAYRIVMQGYWLEGGSATFWFQPLYRWIVGGLHLLFGDSSAGEWFWDGACLLAGALFAFRIVRPMAGGRWALITAVLPLAVMTWGTAQSLIGLGLSEISSAGFMSLAALFAIRARRTPRAALAAGVLATLAFYTRLNNLPMAFGVACFAVTGFQPFARWRAALIVVACVVGGVVLFALRTWHYTGVFSVLYGTQRDLLAIWRPGLSIRDGIARTFGSVMMVLTVNDPARFDVYALPVLAGSIAALGAALRLPRLRELPADATLFFFSSIASAFVARGSAYPGRFSVHVIPITCALAVCALAALAGQTKNAESSSRC